MAWLEQFAGGPAQTWQSASIDKASPASTAIEVDQPVRFRAELRRTIGAAMIARLCRRGSCAQNQAGGQQAMGQMMGIVLSVGAAVGSALLIKELTE